MKTRILSLILTLALLLTAFAGCSGESETPSGSSGQSSENGDLPAETEPDYSWFSMPEETGKLEIYSPGNAYSSVLNPAIEIFKDLYPEIEVSYTILSNDEFETMIRTEIPAGKGPDLVLFSGTTFPDIYKTISTKLFSDLNPYFYIDEDIVLSDFVQGVMDGGVQNGNRYFVPLNYNVPIILTTQSILTELNVSEEDLNTCDGFADAALRFKNKYPDSTLFFDLCQGNFPYLTDIRTLYKNYGFNFIDYEANSVDINETRFHQCIDIVKSYYNPDYDTTDSSKMMVEYYYGGGALLNKMCIYDDYCGSSYSVYINSANYLESKGEKTILFTQKNQNDGVTAELILCAAIPTGSANKSSAWKLMKILLSDSIQGGHDVNRRGNSIFWTGFPVRKSSLRSAIDIGSELTPEGEKMDQYIANVQSPTEALLIPNVYRKYIDDEIMPYIRGEASWDDCWKHFLNTVEFYKDE